MKTAIAEPTIQERCDTALADVHDCERGIQQLRDEFHKYQQETGLADDGKH